MKQIVSIIPRLPPIVDGIGDYALSLARALREQGGVETNFVVGDPTWEGPESVAGFAVQRLAVRDAGALLELLPSGQSATLLLHYEGYGYANRGCPLWLIEALQRWRKDDGGRKLLTMFHELYAQGPMWSSSFWLSPVQRRLATRLARISDGCLTSLEAYAHRLARMSAGRHAQTPSLPVFSSVGEPDALPLPLAQRRRQMVVFGTYGRRLEVYKRSALHLQRVCRALQVEEILDIGKPLAPGAIPDLGAPVSVRGELSSVSVSEALAGAVAGVIDYPAHMLGKSTIFAAYCAYRLIPIVAAYGDDACMDGLEPNKHYRFVDDNKEELTLSTGQTIANNAYDWYQAHKLSVHAKAVTSRLIANSGNVTELRAAHAKS
ncbi:MAG: glycosyltransferase [Pyrinomonadaceae bacterium]